LSPTEAAVVRRVRRAKLFLFLREHRHELFDDAFQTELAALDKESALGQPPVPPAQLALATLLQAYVGCSDDEAVAAAVMDRRWQLALDCLDAEEAPFSKGTLVAFRNRLIAADLARQAVRLTELHIDRAYLSSRLVRDRPPDLQIYCKSWPVREGPHFAKTAFTLDWAAHTIRCPGGEVVPFACGETLRFPAATCAVCALRDRCTASPAGRSVSIHPDERLLAELRERQRTPAGRAKLRERVAVAHSLAHVGRWQGDRARYVGTRKNLFDLRRCAVIHNLHVIARLPAAAPEPAEPAA
jgi:transposase